MSLLSVAAGLALTVPVSYLCWKRKDLPARWARAVMMLPWCLPGSVIGINLINAFNKRRELHENDVCSLLSKYVL